MKKTSLLVLTAFVAAVSAPLSAQTTAPAAGGMSQEEMQKRSKSSASGQMATEPGNKSGAAPTGASQGSAMQKASKSSASGSAAVDTKDKKAMPRKAAKDMTPEEKQKLLDTAQKASKP